MFKARFILGVLLCASALAADGRAARSETAVRFVQTRPATQQGGVSDKEALPWLTGLHKGYANARAQERPVLVRAGAPWCAWCKRLADEIAKPAVQNELARWTLVYIDVDRSSRDARSLDIGPVPALRAVTGWGRVVASRDGYLFASELVQWLKANYEQAAVAPAPPLTGNERPDSRAVSRLVTDLSRRDAVLREWAIRRLLEFRAVAARAVVEAFVAGPLATRLAALELLREWEAPIDTLDPWFPQTFTTDRLQVLKDWAERSLGDDSTKAPESAKAPDSEETPSPQTPDELAAKRAPLPDDSIAAARREIAQLLQTKTDREAKVIRERLVRHGPALLAEVYAQLDRATNDRHRERLRALRYRLVAADALVLSWPGGLDRLASMDIPTRHQAVYELSERAGADDEPLLLELFSDPDALVREISLRALQDIGSEQATTALARFLNDPEPNVRAAVLKQFAEKPSSKIVPEIVAYIFREQDSDLVVHAVRALRATKSAEAVKCLLNLWNHASWQVRAETAEAVSKALSHRRGLSWELKAKACDILVKMLDDEDGFVVSQALKGLQAIEMKGAVEPLVRAAMKHPELADPLLELMARKPSLRYKAIPHLSSFCKHESPAVRAAAIRALCSAGPRDIQEELRLTLSDDERAVRLAAARGFFALIESQRTQPDDEGHVQVQPRGLLQKALRTFSSKRREMDKPMRESQWLEGFRSGKNRPKWMTTLIEPLKAMLTTQDAEEQVAAAVALIPLGQQERALPVLFMTVSSQPEFAAAAAGVLPWIDSPVRSKLVNELTALDLTPAQLAPVALAIGQLRDKSAAEPLWDRLVRDDATPEAAVAVLDALRQLYFGDHYRHPSRVPWVDQRRAADDAKRRVKSGSELQRLVALTLLLTTSQPEATEAAHAVMKDPEASDLLQTDAFQILLLSLGAYDGQQSSVHALSSPNARIRKVAMAYLADDVSTLQRLHVAAFGLVHDNDELQTHESYHVGQPFKPAARKGLDPNAIRHLLDDEDPETAAYAGYVLALLRDPVGLEQLVRYWREDMNKDPFWLRRVYQAISALDDERHLLILEELYHELKTTNHLLKDFYWTVCSMDGPKVREFRRKIRKEVGMSRLK